MQKKTRKRKTNEVRIREKTAGLTPTQLMEIHRRPEIAKYLAIEIANNESNLNGNTLYAVAKALATQLKLGDLLTEGGE